MQKRIINEKEIEEIVSILFSKFPVYPINIARILYEINKRDENYTGRVVINAMLSMLCCLKFKRTIDAEVERQLLQTSR